jgi:lipopolysaccharide transport system permease protein
MAPAGEEVIEAPASPITPDAATPGTSRVTVIRPASRLPRLEVAELWHFRELLWTLVWRDIVVRYKQTFLGIAWALLVPAFTALVYIVVLGRLAKIPHGGLH